MQSNTKPHEDYTATVPPGYIKIDPATAVHVAMLRQHCRDVDRFRTVYPLIDHSNTLADVERLVAEAGYTLDDYIEVADESISLHQYLVVSLKDTGNLPPPLFYVAGGSL